MQESPRLTQLSKGSGCGCKIQPSTLKEILDGMRYQPKEGDKIVLGNSSNDDASVYDLGNGQYLLQTVDFFGVTAHSSDWCTVGLSNHIKAWWQLGNFIAMTHPNIQCVPLVIHMIVYVI